MTRASPGDASAGPRPATAARSRARNPASPSSAKIAGIGRPAAASTSSSTSTNVGAVCGARSRRPTAVFPVPGRPTSTRSIGRLSRPRRCRPRSRTGVRPPTASRRGRRDDGRDALAVAPQVVARLVERVAAHLVEDEVGDREQDHRLADDAGGGHHADVAALVVGLLDRLAGQEVGRRERARERRDRLHGTADDERLAVGHAAREAAGVVGPMDPRAVRSPPVDDVVDLRPQAPGLLEAEPELDALHDLDARDAPRERGVESTVPVDVRADTDREAVDDDLEDAADRVAGRPRLVDPGDHRGLRVGVGAAQRARVGLVAAARAPRRVHRHAADLRGERPRLDPELAEERPGDRAGRDPGRRLPRGRALEDVPDVGEAVLERAGEVRVAGPDPRHGRGPLHAALGRRGELGRLRVRQRRHLHDPRPVLPVAVLDRQEDRRAERPPVADARRDRRVVALDRLPRAATVPPLPAREVVRDHLLRQREAGRHPLDDDPERAPVRLARGEESERAHGAAQSPADAASATGASEMAASAAGVSSAGVDPPDAMASSSFSRMRSSGAAVPGPQLEGGGPLVEEHPLAVHDVAAGGLGLAHEPRLRRVVDEVEHEEVRREELARDRRLVRVQADRGRVHEDLRLRQLGLEHRLVPRHGAELHVRGAPAEELHDAPRRGGGGG